VLDERRFPAAGAHVVARSPVAAGTSECVTASDGSFAIAVPFAPPSDGGCTASLVASTGDGRVGHDVVAWFDEQSFESGRTLELRTPILLARGGELVVDAHDARGAVAGASVELRPHYDRRAVAETTTDEQGRARLASAPPGEFTLVVAKEGRGRRSAEARIRSGATTRLDVELKPARSLTVEVVDVDGGATIEGATIEVTRMAEGPNPGPFLSLNRIESLFGQPRMTDASGRLTVKDLEAESMLLIQARAAHYVLGDPLVDRPPVAIEVPAWRASQRVAAEAGRVRLTLKRLVPWALRWRIVAGDLVPPPDGTPLSVRLFDEPWNLRGSVGRWKAAPAHPGVVRNGAVEIEVEIPPGTAMAPLDGIAEAPDGAIAELAAPRDDERGAAARFERGASLTAKLLAHDGSPRPDAAVGLAYESHGDLESRRSPPARYVTTDASGFVRFTALRRGRWIVTAEDVARVVDLRRGDVACVLAPTPAAEIVLAFTVGGERRLPRDFEAWLEGELRSLRREDPARGDLHLYVTRPPAGAELDVIVGLASRGTLRRRLPPFPAEGVFRVPIMLPAEGDGEVIARILHAREMRVEVTLERFDEATGRFVAAEPSRLLYGTPNENAEGQRVRDLEPGLWRLAAQRVPLVSEPARVAAGGPAAELTLDAANVANVSVVFQVPDGENADFLDLDVPSPWPRRERWLRSWESEWPLEPANGATRELLFDRAHPPSLRVVHPYLVGTRWNDAIDLKKPRSTITLHVSAGPLVTLAPELPAGAAEVRGAFVTLVGEGSAADGAPAAAEVRRALRRGAAFVLALPAAGEYRVLIDPVVAAPVELGRVAFDGGPRDLGTLRFSRGSTLRVHATAPPPFAAPLVHARAIRLDGIAYERASSIAQAVAAPGEPEIRALGPGLFRVTLATGSGWNDREWSGEVRLDGEHDAELTIDTE